MDNTVIAGGFVSSTVEHYHRTVLGVKVGGKAEVGQRMQNALYQRRKRRKVTIPMPAIEVPVLDQSLQGEARERRKKEIQKEVNSKTFDGFIKYLKGNDSLELRKCARIGDHKKLHVPKRQVG